MKPIAYQNALTVLEAMPFAANEMEQIRLAAQDLPWDDLLPFINRMQFPETAEAAEQEMMALITQQDTRHSGLCGMCVIAASMYETARRLHAQGISKQVLLDTFCCLHRMAGEYVMEFGRLGFDRCFWVWRQACGQIFRLGTLEFEYLTLSEWGASKTGLTAGTPVLSVHIPSGADLSRAALDESYRQAGAFYTAHPEVCLQGGKKPEAIYCSSWLLCPTLRTLLSETSGIRRFAEDFSLTHIEKSSNGFYHFLYWVNEEKTSINDLPEHTSLQRAVKNHLLNGGCIGSGSGLLKANPF